MTQDNVVIGELWAEPFKGVRSARLVVAFDGTGLEIWPVGLIRICGEEQEKPGN